MATHGSPPRSAQIKSREISSRCGPRCGRAVRLSGHLVIVTTLASGGNRAAPLRPNCSQVRSSRWRRPHVTASTSAPQACRFLARAARASRLWTSPTVRSGTFLYHGSRILGHTMAEPVYLDNAATTPVDPRVFEAMRQYWLEDWGNPSSVYAVGRRARRALDNARDRCAEVLNCRANEIIFTGCGSESDNLAIKGSAIALSEQRGWKHVVTSKVEHHAVLHACQWLEKHLGFEITYLDVDRFGWVDPASVAAAVRGDTAVVSIMYANNEVGTIEPVAEIARAVKTVNPLTVVHTDAVQAGGLMRVDV